VRFLLIIGFVYTHTLFSQNNSSERFLFKEFINEDNILPYRILEPKDNKKRLPLIIFLHGSGERGDDNKLQLIHGGSFFLEKTKKKRFSSYVVFPQCQVNNRWSSEKKDPWLHVDEKKEISEISLYGKMVIELIEFLINEKSIDTDRIYIAGLSMGGYGTFELVSRRPDLFAAAVPICGGANFNILNNSVNVPHWIFHGSIDSVVPVQNSRDAFNFLIKEKPHHKYTEFEEVDHNSWENVFDDGKFLKWLFSKSKN
jgi:predicted peptidase